MGKELELTGKQVERLDTVDNAALEYLQVLTQAEDLGDAMEFIGELNDFAAELMTRAGYKIYYPFIATDANGKQHCEDYYALPEEEKEETKLIDGAFWDKERFGDEYLSEDGHVPEWFARYEVKVVQSKGGRIIVWARSEEEAMEIGDSLTNEEFREYVRQTGGGMKVKMKGKVK